MQEVVRGATVALDAVYRDAGENLVDPVTPLVDILDPANVVIVADAVPVRSSLGLYDYPAGGYLVPADADFGVWTARWTGTVDGDLIEALDEFEVVAATVAVPAGALASITDVECRLGRSLTDAESDRMECLLRDASAAVRAYTGQQITAGTTTARLKVKGGMIRLPQRPVTEVSAVATTGGTALFHTWSAGSQIWLSTYLPSANLAPHRNAGQYADVTYAHGYDVTPDDIVAVVCQMATRAFGTSPDQTGVQSETVVSYSYQLGAAAAAGGIGMLPAERQVLDRYKAPAGPIMSERR